MNKTLIFAGGCFWGIEDLIRHRPGVVDTAVGYTGGQNRQPTYEFHPGHAEAIRVTFDEKQTSYAKIFDYFFSIHDPTTLNRQGDDIGESYRSAIFYENDEQLKTAEAAIVRAQKHWPRQIVTKLEKLIKFHSAENYHQDYIIKNPGGYTCHFERY